MVVNVSVGVSEESATTTLTPTLFQRCKSSVFFDKNLQKYSYTFALFRECFLNQSKVQGDSGYLIKVPTKPELSIIVNVIYNRQIDKSIWLGPAGAAGKWNIFRLYNFAFFKISRQSLRNTSMP